MIRRLIILLLIVGCEDEGDNKLLGYWKRISPAPTISSSEELVMGNYWHIKDDSIKSIVSKELVRFIDSTHYSTEGYYDVFCYQCWNISYENNNNILDMVTPLGSDPFPTTYSSTGEELTIERTIGISDGTTYDVSSVFIYNKVNTIPNCNCDSILQTMEKIPLP